MVLNYLKNKFPSLRAKRSNLQTYQARQTTLEIASSGFALLAMTKRFIFFICIVLAATLLAACRASADNTPAPTLTALEERGQAVFNLRCAQCHALVPDTVVIGPSLAGIATRGESRVPGMDALEYIETSILYPKDYLVPEFTDTMPTNFSKELTSDEFDSVVAFLMTLK